ncbi:hypothetical protein [Streptomyces olivaceoviridis]|uniref:hypothetical protein n=1 Tax=Streptomyces olivaceoviridis TaxID=1921 RepID=UPI0033257759
MHVLLPDDVVFKAMWHMIEEPLLHSLYYYYLRELEPEQAEMVRSAYDSWGEIQQQLPPPLQWQELPPAGGRPRQVPQGYRLHDPRGRELMPLYAVKVGSKQLDQLEACQRMLAQATTSPAGPLTDALDELSDDHSVEDFRRALAVMRIPATPRLLETLRRGTPTGPDIAITLDADQAGEYRDLCRELVYRLSAGDRFTYTTHSALFNVA